ncbi:MAG: VOC family protein [Gammaproteobacteria bacterium]|nr:VOC family protein [Gammaproteobacteria bacterium]
MKLELDHVFILVEAGGAVADLVAALGLKESFSRAHPGQGTTNRRFELSNSLLEFLWVHDSEEAHTGPGRELKFNERSGNSEHSPFGLILKRAMHSDDGSPYDGWTYQPSYFKPPNAFHIGENSSNLIEPLCIYAPFLEPNQSATTKEPFSMLSHVTITTPATPLSNVAHSVNAANRISIRSGDQHLMELTLDANRKDKTKDFRPDIPLIINW